MLDDRKVVIYVFVKHSASGQLLTVKRIARHLYAVPLGHNPQAISRAIAGVDNSLYTYVGAEVIPDQDGVTDREFRRPDMRNPAVAAPL